MDFYNLHFSRPILILVGKSIENNKHSAKALAIVCFAVMCHVLMDMVMVL
jgi:hypothetical protein